MSDSIEKELHIHVHLHNSYISGDMEGLEEFAVAIGDKIKSDERFDFGKEPHAHIHLHNSYVNGDAKEIALLLRKEIEKAEVSGY